MTALGIDPGQADTRTLEAIVLGLAQRKRPQCSLCYRELEHPICDGTGQVAEFPTLREPCSHCKDSKGKVQQCPRGEYFYLHKLDYCAYHNETLAVIDCPDCGGRGWLPVTTTDALVAAARSLLDFVRVMFFAKGNVHLVLHHVTYAGFADTDEEAIILALEAAKKQEAADASR